MMPTPGERDLEKHIAMFGLNPDGTAPELHEDLVDYLVDDPNLGQVLKHPLVFQIPYHPTMNGLSNMLYESKLKALQEAETDKNWTQILMLHERPYRIQAFIEYAEDMSDEEYWDLLSWIWTDSENIWQNLYFWKLLLTNPHRSGRSEWIMDNNDKEMYESLPETVTIWRGTCAPDGVGCDISWTTNKTKASWFATRLAMPGMHPVLHEGTVNKQNIIACFVGRNEDEVVAMPKHIKNRKVTALE